MHTKASEQYVHVHFKYGNKIWDGWIPVEYRRTGVSIQNENENELSEYLNSVYEQLQPQKFSAWLEDQKIFWADKQRASTTKAFFDSLINGGWQCVNCTLPSNPNWARRIQDLKEFGYTIATNTNQYCAQCGTNKTHILLIPIPRGGVEGNGYETWSPTLRKRILKVLGGVDVYENTKNPHLLPDHKFSEIRWDRLTKGVNPDDMTDEEIMQKFQLLTNQRNQQKREVCRTCFQTGKRGILFGIPYFYHGDQNWDNHIPKNGKDAEQGCVGCAWYDIERWRKHLISKLHKNCQNP